MKLLKIVAANIFIRFEYRFVFEIKFTNLTNNEEVNSPINLAYMHFKSE